MEAALKCTEKPPFKIILSHSTTELISHIGKFGRFRYLETSYFTHGPKLVQLDRAVWELRRYCRVIDFELRLSDGSTKKMLSAEIDRIERSVNQSPHKFQIIGGELENILNKKEHAAPLFLHPEILDEVLKYVFIPKAILLPLQKRQWELSTTECL